SETASGYIRCACAFANPPCWREAHEKDNSVQHSPFQVRRHDSRRPVTGTCTVVEVAGVQHGDGRSFDRHEENGTQPHNIARTEDNGGKIGNIEYRPLAHSLHTSVAFLRCDSPHFVQYQPMIVR